MSFGCLVPASLLAFTEIIYRHDDPKKTQPGDTERHVAEKKKKKKDRQGAASKIFAADKSPYLRSHQFKGGAAFISSPW